MVPVLSHRRGTVWVRWIPHLGAGELGPAASVFLASAVEAVEALTVVLAIGSTRSRPPTLSAAPAACTRRGQMRVGVRTSP